MQMHHLNNGVPIEEKISGFFWRRPESGALKVFADGDGDFRRDGGGVSIGQDFKLLAEQRVHTDLRGVAAVAVTLTILPGVLSIVHD